MRHCSSLAETLFVQMTLADERAVRATWVGGACAYDRGSPPAR
jgi:guanine deaminase